MTSWQKILKNSISSPAQIPNLSKQHHEEILEVTKIYPMRINPYYMSLIQKTGDPLWRQAVPDIQEEGSELMLFSLRYMTDLIVKYFTK